MIKELSEYKHIKYKNLSISDLLDKGNKSIIFFYKDIEFSSGFRVKYDVDLENIIKNIEGINNIKKIM